MHRDIAGTYAQKNTETYRQYMHRHVRYMCRNIQQMYVHIETYMCTVIHQTHAEISNTYTQSQTTQIDR